MNNKNIYYRIPHSFDEIDSNSLCGIAESQLQRLTLNTNYEDIQFIDHSYMIEEGSDIALYVVKHNLLKDDEKIYCYSVFGNTEDGDYQVPMFFSNHNSMNAISIYEVNKTFGLDKLGEAIKASEYCNYIFFF